jgi:hypothetical protein
MEITMVFKQGDIIFAAKAVHKCPGAWLDKEARCYRKRCEATVLGGPFNDGHGAADYYEVEFRDGSRGTFNMVKSMSAFRSAPLGCRPGRAKPNLTRPFKKEAPGTSTQWRNENGTCKSRKTFFY